jgi:DNA-directed RNA polymerase specialized sigma24 family protein
VVAATGSPRGAAASVAAELYRTLRQACLAWIADGDGTAVPWPASGEVETPLAMLEQDTRTAVLLDREGLGAHEIGYVLGCSADMARSQVARGRASLRASLMRTSA